MSRKKLWRQFAMFDQSTGEKMKLDFQAEALKAAPAVGGTIWSAVTLSNAVATATLIYILLQAAYLIWKWCKEAKEKNGN